MSDMAAAIKVTFMQRMKQGLGRLLGAEPETGMDALPVRVHGTEFTRTAASPVHVKGFDQPLVWVTFALMMFGLVMAFNALSEAMLDALQAASLASWNAQDLPLAHAACAALLGYAEHTQGRALAHVQTLSVQRATDLLDLPPATHRNLELTQTLRGEPAPTLLSLLDSDDTAFLISPTSRSISDTVPSWLVSSGS